MSFGFASEQSENTSKAMLRPSFFNFILDFLSSFPGARRYKQVIHFSVQTFEHSIFKLLRAPEHWMVGLIIYRYNFQNEGELIYSNI